MDHQEKKVDKRKRDENGIIIAHDLWYPRLSTYNQEDEPKIEFWKNNRFNTLSQLAMHMKAYEDQAFNEWLHRRGINDFSQRGAPSRFLPEDCERHLIGNTSNGIYGVQLRLPRLDLKLFMANFLESHRNIFADERWTYALVSSSNPESVMREIKWSIDMGYGKVLPSLGEGIYNTVYWACLSKAYRSIIGQCETPGCGSKEDLHCHHDSSKDAFCRGKNYEYIGREILNPKLCLTVLCRKCHKKRHPDQKLLD